MGNTSFYIKSSQIEGRLDPEFYRPEIMAIEKKVRSQSTKRLRHFIERVSSGATPSVKEEAKFYSDAENGIPFLRVQNLQTNCQLSLGDVRYVNKETHDNMLRRSQVSENDLLVKITGVGRMAIASVAPSGFVGNTNQHMVVIKTDNAETSEYLANYLNLDIVEKLASRRSTGGTRPALDYPALKSIPIIENLDFSLIKKAYILKQQKEAEAKTLLDGIDDYLLGELGIVIPKRKTSLEDRIFFTNLNSVSGGRFDTKPYDSHIIALKKAISNFNKDRFTSILLNSITVSSVAGDWGLENTTDVNDDDYIKCLVIRATEFNNEYNLSLFNNRVKYRYIHKLKYQKLNVQENDILIEKSGGSPDQPVGRVAILTDDELAGNSIAYSNFIHKIRVDGTKISPSYLFCFLRTMYHIGCTEYMQSQTNGIRNLIMRDYLRQNIIVPKTVDGKVDIDKQNKIANHISEIKAKAKQLQQEGTNALEDAKKEVEKMIV